MTDDFSPHLNKDDMLKSFNGYYFRRGIEKLGSGKTILFTSLLTEDKIIILLNMFLIT